MRPTKKTATHALQQVPFFTRLNAEEASVLAEKLILRRFNANQIIFHLGDPGGLLYIITSGKVKISYSNPDGQEALLAILGPGDFFGELSLLDSSPRSATAEAIEPTETYTLDGGSFNLFLDHTPGFAHHVLSVLATRMRVLNAQLSDIFFLDLPARLARTLLRLADQYGKSSPSGIQIDIALTQTDLAEMTGGTRVSINKALGRFRRSKWVDVSGRHFTIRDRDALINLIQISGG
jgi:CRP-like cAMP-binding protein